MAIWSLFVLGIICNGQSLPRCVFRDAASSGQQLDLRALADTTLSKTDDSTPANLFQFAPCRNSINLDICAPDTAMAVKTRSADCWILAKWDAAAQETLPSFDAIIERWTFNYTTGEDCDGKPYTFFAYFNCDPHIGDYRVVSVGTPRACTGQMTIDTEWACPGEVYTTQPPVDKSLGAGSIIVILLLIAFLIYFSVGYIVCAILNRKDHGYCDVESNIPHIVFWMKLPTLVIAGFCFTKDYIVALLCDVTADKTDVLVQHQVPVSDDINAFENTVNKDNDPFVTVKPSHPL